MAKQAVFVLGFAVVFGIFVPWYRGFDFLDPVLITAYSCLALLFVAPASAEAFASGEGPLTMSETVQKSAMVLSFGWGIAVLVLIAGIVTVNLSHWHGYVLAPSAKLLTSALLLSLTASIVVIGSCGLLVRRFSTRAVKGFMRLAFLIVLVILAFGDRILPERLRAMLAEHATTDGIANLSFVSSAVLGTLGVILMALLLRPSAQR